MSYIRVTIQGTAPGGEVWSINPVFDPTGEMPNFPLQSNLDAAAAAVAALSPGSDLLSSMSSSLFLSGARLEVRDDTDDSLVAISIATRATPLIGVGAAKMAPQCAQVFSLRTDTPGGSGRGRLYWPAVGSGIGADLRVTSAGTNALVAGMKTYLMAIKDALAAQWIGAGFDLAVRSRATKSTPHVVRLQTGNVIDTQRRRRDNLAESYSTVSIP